MALTANYKTSSKTITAATFRILRIWGSKQEGWNAWVGVFADANAQDPDEQFSVNTPYVEGQNPFDALYSAVGALSFVEGAVHDVTTALNSVKTVEAVVEDTKPAPAKKSRKKE